MQSSISSQHCQTYRIFLSKPPLSNHPPLHQSLHCNASNYLRCTLLFAMHSSICTAIMYIMPTLPNVLVSNPTRWSLLFIIGTLCASSSKQQRNIVQLCATNFWVQRTQLDVEVMWKILRLASITSWVQTGWCWSWVMHSWWTLHLKKSN